MRVLRARARARALFSSFLLKFYYRFKRRARQIERLIKMDVLLPESAAETEYSDQTSTKLTTKMVRTWRKKTVEGKDVWFRRSRFVAREYAFLAERADLFSPASTALGNRLLPILYLQHAQDPSDPWILCSLDVADAYLTVKQTLLVNHGDCRFVLGRLLPGQRIASKEWYQDFSSHLDTQLSFAKCPALPSLARDPLHKFFMQLHVDDMWTTCWGLDPLGSSLTL